MPYFAALKANIKQVVNDKHNGVVAIKEKVDGLPEVVDVKGIDIEENLYSGVAVKEFGGET